MNEPTRAAEQPDEPRAADRPEAPREPAEVERTGASSPEPAQTRSSNTLARDLMSSSGMLITLAIILALVIGAVLVASFSEGVRTSIGYFFNRPGDFFVAFGSAFVSYFDTLFRGAIFNYQAYNVAGMFRPLSETLTSSVPLIFAGLSVAVAFRGGLFNIGGAGQLIMGAIAAGYVGFAFDLPPVIHLLACLVAAMLAGSLWGGLVGLLKAKANANEVIVTIMLNSIAALFLSYLLNQPAFYGEGTSGISRTIADTAAYPKLIDLSMYRVHAGLLVALLVAALVWWLMERSTFGFELRAVGENPDAARVAGMSVPRVIVLTMLVAGALAGLAGTAPALGTDHVLTTGMAANYGFDAITVALLGRSRPVGTVLAALLFGALNAGGSFMQTVAVPIDIVSVAQAVIVLLISAPPLVRFIFRLPEPRDRRVLVESLPQPKKEVSA